MNRADITLLQIDASSRLAMDFAKGVNSMNIKPLLPHPEQP